MKSRLLKAKELKKCCRPAKAVENGIKRLYENHIDGRTFLEMDLQSFLEIGVDQNVANALMKMASYFEQVKYITSLHSISSVQLLIFSKS